MLRVDITRYITPLREGSSLPGLVEADDGARATFDASHLAALRADAQVDALRNPLALVERIAAGEIGSGPIHGGVTDDPAATFEHLYATLVDRPSSSEASDSDGPQQAP